MKEPTTLKQPITLKTLPQATAQEVFDQVATHLLTQQECSVDDVSTQCRYRIEKNGKVLRCAAGCLIADDEYDTIMEGCTWDIGRRFVPDRHQDLIRRLQKIHDNNPPNEWYTLLCNTAVYYNLSFNVLDQFVQ